MIDLIERQVLANMLIEYLNGKSGWNELDAFLTKNTSCDNAILEIGFEFWTFIDPEWPENVMNIRYALVFRTLLFLHSTQEYEYVEPKDTRGLHMKIIDFLQENIYLILCIIVGFVSGIFLGFWYGIFCGFICGILVSVVIRPHKIKPPLPKEETEAFWPFASREAYLMEKETNGKRFESLMDRLPLKDDKS